MNVRMKVTVRRVSGIALIEAIIALAILLGGVAAILSFQSVVAGKASENRAAGFALAAVQSKIEELRSLDFHRTSTDAALVDGNHNDEISDYMSFVGPGAFIAGEVTIKRCWSVAPDMTRPEYLREKMRLVRVWAVNEGAECSATPLAQLETYIARQDPTSAARNLAMQIAADGDAEILHDKSPPEGATPGPGGFYVVRDNDGAISMVIGPDGRALAPKSGPLQIAYIHGNIIFDGSYLTPSGVFANLEASWNFTQTPAINEEQIIGEIRKVVGTTISAEGNGLCTIHYPGLDLYSDPPLVPQAPVLTGPSASITYLQYTCVVPNRWRRSLWVSAPIQTSRVCVGSPVHEQADSLVDLLAVGGRAYQGWRETVDAQGVKRHVWEGIRGKTDGTAAFGTICEADQPCYSSSELKNWVAGGHHFFVKNADSERCATGMSRVLAGLDTVNSSGVPLSMYHNLFRNNPHAAYCINDKVFNQSVVTLIQQQLADEEISSVSSSVCAAYTGVSGFMENNAATQDGLRIFQANAANQCYVVGPLGDKGGFYSCVAQDSSVSSYLAWNSRDNTFTPSRCEEVDGELVHKIYSSVECDDSTYRDYQYISQNIAHDLVGMDFKFLPKTPGTIDFNLCKGISITGTFPNPNNNEGPLRILVNGILSGNGSYQVSGGGSNAAYSVETPDFHSVSEPLSVKVSYRSKSGNTWTTTESSPISLTSANVSSSTNECTATINLR